MGAAETGVRRPILLDPEMTVSGTLIDGRKRMATIQALVICHFFLLHLGFSIILTVGR